MATIIEWTDETWNPTVGCTRISPGCKNCYAFALHDMRHAAYKDGKDLPEQYAKPFKTLQLMEDRLDKPLHWKKPRRVFVNSMSDLFHEDVPDSFIDSVFRVMFDAKAHTFQVLTKRAERMQEYVSRRWGAFGGREYPPVPNVWLGVSVEDQQRADERIPHLLQTPAAVRFLSCEPLLGPVDLENIKWDSDMRGRAGNVIYGSMSSLHGLVGCKYPVPRDRVRPVDWVIIGGESGPGSRPCNVAHVRSLVQQCAAAGVACFVKQLGAHVIDRGTTSAEHFPIEQCWGDVRLDPQDAHHVILRDKKGGTPEEWPEDLRVRDFPSRVTA